MIVSRDEPEIRRGLSNESPYDPVFEHRIIPEDVQNDVLTYCRSIVEEKLSTKTDEAKNEITEKLADRCNGQFLWVRLQQDTLRSGKSQRKLEQAINSTPSGIEHIYERNWMKIMGLTEEDRTRAISLLRWTAFSLRPLTISEISGALVISEDDGELLLDDLPDSIDEDYVNTEIKELCGSLLEVRDAQDKSDARLKTVHLTHFSVKEYLLRNLPIEGKVLQLNSTFSSTTEGIENTIIAKKCLRFVDSQEAWLGTSAEVLSTFQKYAAGSWYQHAKLGDLGDIKLMSAITTFFDPRNPNWASWKAWFDVNNTKAEEDATCGVATAGPLYYAAWFGLTDPVAFLIRELKSDINDKGYHEQTPLGVASEEGHFQVVKALLEQGADVAMVDIDGWTPIYTASRNGHTKVVRLLIEFGANVDTTENSGSTPINVACHQGHVETVKLLLEHGADTTASNNGITPLCTATYHGHTRIVELLLEYGADIYAAANDRLTPLMCASAPGHIEVVRLLLERGANVEAKDIYGNTALLLASCFGRAEVVELLLQNSAGVTICDVTGTTSLYEAAYRGRVDVVEILLRTSSTHVDVLDQLNRSPLFPAAARGHLDVVNILLSHNANAIIRDHYHSTPLFAAIRNGHRDVAERLIALAKYPIHFQNDLGQTLLWWAAKCGDAETVDLICRWNKEHDIEVDENDLRVEGTLVQLGQSSRYCDVCVRYLPANKVYHKCKDCFDFDICSECFDMGARCFSDSHQWTIHRLEGDLTTPVM